MGRWCRFETVALHTKHNSLSFLEAFALVGVRVRLLIVKLQMLLWYNFIERNLMIERKDVKHELLFSAKTDSTERRHILSRWRNGRRYVA